MSVQVNVPGSKSITNRALALAMRADGEVIIEGALFSGDSRHMLDCIKALGFRADSNEAGLVMRVAGQGGEIPCKEATIDVGSSGTAARFLTAILGVSTGDYTITASPQMCARPMRPLLEALGKLGCKIEYLEQPGHLPYVLHGHGYTGERVQVDISESSQFLSALMLAGVDVQSAGEHGMAYVEMTRRMIEEFHSPYTVEPDVSAACYFYAAAALTGRSVVVSGVHRASLQGDIAFLDTLCRMGASMRDTPHGIELTGHGLTGVAADLSAYSDQAITLAAIAPYADSPTTITGIGHIRLQESDRLSAIVENLTACGIRTECGGDFLTIYPGHPHGTLIRTHDDHRLAMGFALMSLMTEGIEIENPACCAKTFPGYFEEFERFKNSILYG